MPTRKPSPDRPSRKKPAGSATGRAIDYETDLPIGARYPLASEVDLGKAEHVGVAGISEDDEAHLDTMVPEGVQMTGILPETVDAFYARDPFSADYVDFLKYKGQARRAERQTKIDLGLRASLLEQPLIMEKPEEAAFRGSAAVWRSLRDQLRMESDKLIDESDPFELDALERDLNARKAIVGAVGRGLDMLLKRVQQRKSEPEPVLAPPPDPDPTKLLD
jgi:hypothetical protein